MIFSHVKISSFRAKAHLVFHWCLHNKTEYLLSELVHDDLGKIAPGKYGQIFFTGLRGTGRFIRM